MTTVLLVPFGITPPVTKPVNEFTEATDELALLHVPPVIGSLNVVVPPDEHIPVIPDIAPGPGMTVTV